MPTAVEIRDGKGERQSISSSLVHIHESDSTIKVTPCLAACRYDRRGFRGRRKRARVWTGAMRSRQQRGNGLPERDAGRVFAGPGVGTSPKARERFCEGPPRTGRVSFVHTGGSLLIV